MRSLFRAIAICGAFANLPAQASAADFRQPTGPWRVDYDTAQCVAMRDYGTEQKPLVLALKPSPRGGVMRILVMRKGFADVQQVPVRLRFGPTVIDKDLLVYPDDKNRFRILGINVPIAEFKANAQAPFLQIDGGCDRYPLRSDGLAAGDH
jgi:hypothetical protein